jgi:hypothetical protein
MTPDFNAWLADTEAIDAEPRAALAWRRINDKPASIRLKRGATLLDAQTVRLEFAEGVSDPQSAAGAAAVRQVTMFGVAGHSHIDDTDVKRGDRFVTGGSEYQVVDVVETLGEVQAHAERI